MAGAKASKTNVTARKKGDLRPKCELHVTMYRKPNGALGRREVLVPINREPEA